jgi:23S rRNA G2445 N2-methylase RlmL
MVTRNKNELKIIPYGVVLVKKQKTKNIYDSLKKRNKKEAEKIILVSKKKNKTKTKKRKNEKNKQKLS